MRLDAAHSEEQPSVRGGDGFLLRESDGRRAGGGMRGTSAPRQRVGEKQMCPRTEAPPEASIGGVAKRLAGVVALWQRLA